MKIPYINSKKKKTGLYCPHSIVTSKIQNSKQCKIHLGLIATIDKYVCSIVLDHYTESPALRMSGPVQGSLSYDTVDDKHTERLWMPQTVMWGRQPSLRLN